MENHGLIEGISPKLVKFDEELFLHIIKARQISSAPQEDKIKEALRWNIITVAMFSDLTGIPVPTLTGKMAPKINGDGDVVTDLNFTFCWPSLGKKGIKFILRDEKSEKLLRR